MKWGLLDKALQISKRPSFDPLPWLIEAFQQPRTKSVETAEAPKHVGLHNATSEVLYQAGSFHQTSRNRTARKTGTPEKRTQRMRHRIGSVPDSTALES